MVFAVWAAPEPVAEGVAELEHSLVASVRLARAEPDVLAFEASERYGYPAGYLARYFEKLRYSFGPRERAGLYTFLEMARDVGELEHVPELRFVGRRDPVAGMTAVETRTVEEILEKALDGERISDEEAVALLRSRELVPVGRVADELRNRKVDPDRITFIVDRNLNYTNICVTDCDFCAFYRSPGDRNEGYLLPKPVIFKKIEETLAIGGTGVLMQGGHHPDLGDRLLRGSLQLDQAALQDPPARALAARDPAHRAALEAHGLGDALAAARLRPRLGSRRRRRDPRRPRPRDHRAEEDQVLRVARRDAPRAQARACRRPRR